MNITFVETFNQLLRNNITYTILFVAVLNIIIIIYLWRIYLSFKALENSFTKLGHIAREDTKKYFNDAAEKAIDIHKNSAEENKKIIEEVTKRAFVDSGNHLKDIFSEAEKEATKIISEAQENGIKIKTQAQKQASKIYEQTINESSQAIDWALKQYIKEEFTLEQHEDIIKKLMKIYEDENRAT